MSARVIELFPKDANTCADCDHAALQTGGIFCTVFAQLIWDERVAADCDAFDGIS